MTAPRPTVTSLDILPVYGQSENRAIPDDLAAALDAATSEQAYYTFGMRDMSGNSVGPQGAGLAEIDAAHPARGFLSAARQGRVSPAYTFQFCRAAAWRDQENAASGVLIGDNGFGGRDIGEWSVQASSPLGRNQIHWLRESARLASEFGIRLNCPHVLLFQGTSAKDKPGSEYRSGFEAAHTGTLASVREILGQDPRLIVVVNGADVNSIGDRYDTPGVQYRIALEHGGILATWQRAFPISDRNIHPDGATQVLIGETCAWAAAEIEAGKEWNITYSVAREGRMVRVDFVLRPGETLIERHGLYEHFGGAATCANFGFEAEGGILEATVDWGGGSVTLTLASDDSSWLRFAHQFQDCSGFLDDLGRSMSAHRSTLFASESRASRFVQGEQLWRPLPGFRGTFVGDQFLPEF
ncbi:hypothetical protein [Paracoccus ravus]|uniref:hypothetical protein n=1 Tax=Paracoccus ravus TaxID=2447760 RepID=UPI00106ECC56|nr:hypothetical protein [Paracoccus ravus]